MEFEDDDQDDFPDSGYAEPESPTKERLINIHTPSDSTTNKISHDTPKLYAGYDSPRAPNKEPPLPLGPPVPPHCLVEETLWELTEGRLFEADANPWLLVKSRIMSPHYHIPADTSAVPDDVPMLSVVNDRRGVGYPDYLQPPPSQEAANADSTSSQAPDDVVYHGSTRPTASPTSCSYLTDGHFLDLGRSAGPTTPIDFSTRFPQTPPRVQPLSFRTLIQDFGVANVKRSSPDDLPPADLFALLDQGVTTFDEIDDVNKLLSSIPTMDSPLNCTFSSPSSPLPNRTPSLWSQEVPYPDNLSEKSLYHSTPTSCPIDSLAWEDPSSLAAFYNSPTDSITDRRVSPVHNFTSDDALEHQVVPGPVLFSDFNNLADPDE